VTTFVVTVAFDLSTAVELGLVLASLFFLYLVLDLHQVISLDNTALDVLSEAHRRLVRWWPDRRPQGEVHPTPGGKPADRR
jgi:MFS superfamily sulfate permease-like transporter